MSRAWNDAIEITHAQRFALRAHGSQKYGDQPYSVHLDAVFDLLCSSHGLDKQAAIVGYLHDVAEDTPVTLKEIEQEFGDLVARCVALVTDAPGATRAERKAATNAKLARVSAESDERIALIVKAADRLANVRASALSGNDEKLKMYRAEHPAFREAAFRPGLCDDLWNAMGLILSERD